MQRINAQLLGYNGSTGVAVPLSKPSRLSRGQLAPALIYILEEVQRELGFSTELETTNELPSNAELQALIQRVSERLGFELSSYERDEILEHLEREQKPFGLLQELVDDPEISDIIVTNYCKIGVQQGRKNYITDISFPSQEAYQSYVDRLLQKAGTTCTTKKPIADGMLGTHARIHVIHPCLCESGPYLTIRLNRFSSVTVDDLVKTGLAPIPVMDYLRAVIKTGATVLVVGEVGTGKTTLTRALASGIAAWESILVIEDTPEIRLEHPHVRYMTTRDDNSDGAGKVAPSECIRGGMRMAMNRIIFGEIRSAEAAEAFVDVCASGHPGLSTIHARSASEAITRLQLFLGRAQKGVSNMVLNEQIVTAVQVIVYVDICKQSWRRRIMEVTEIGPVADGQVREREIFKYQCNKGVPCWRVVNKLSAHRAMMEGLEVPVVLSSYQNVLELDLHILFKEACNAR